MDVDHTDPRLQRAKVLAGSKYQEMLQSEENTLELLSSSKHNLCEAAILVCEVFWKWGQDQRVVEACYKIADSDAHKSNRISVLNSLGRLLSATKALDASQYLAKIVCSSRSSNDLKLSAYWALREIQFGKEDPDFLKSVISATKFAFRENPGKFSEDELRLVLTPQPGFSVEFWDASEQMDIEFVKQFL